ncbi:hypothetical protein NDU88_004413 [Pleurodeles waltl]|uniref:Uncharacterized protein n=1 Tax=Pleurodeles waltl TaxID=8319 RepID=A0AAV7M7G6_PLEWA|nr:hypothetical protein NDU88_004413 [Pleurodeles waltl]
MPITANRGGSGHRLNRAGPCARGITARRGGRPWNERQARTDSDGESKHPFSTPTVTSTQNLGSKVVYLTEGLVSRRGPGAPTHHTKGARSGRAERTWGLPWASALRSQTQCHKRARDQDLGTWKTKAYTYLAAKAGPKLN